MAPLLAGALLALAALAYVLYPLVVDRHGVPVRAPDSHRDADVAERAGRALDEAAFDRAAGKLSEEDYQAWLREHDADAMQAAHATADSAPDDAVEVLVSRYRDVSATCPVCGVRPEPAARYCSSCGRPLV